MSLLKQSVELYRSILAEKKGTDAMPLQMKEFIVTHFGHEGTKGIKEVEGSTIVHTYKKQNGGKELRRFQHPLALPGIGTRTTRITPQAEATEEPAVTMVEGQIEQPAAQGEPVPAQVGEPSDSNVNPPSKSEKPLGVVVEKIDVNLIAEMSPKAIAKMYKRQTIVDALKEQGVQYNVKGSEVQLAAALLTFVKTGK